MPEDSRGRIGAFDLRSVRFAAWKLSPSLRQGLSLAIAALLSAAFSSQTSAAPPGDWRAKVDPFVLAQWDGAESNPQSGVAPEIEFFAVLVRQADLAQAKTLASRAERGAFVVSRLQSLAQLTQASLLLELASRGLETRSFWVANMIWVRGDASSVELVAQRSDVARVAGNPSLRAVEPLPRESESGPSAVLAVEPNLSLVGAPDVWALGITGQNVVVGSADTGVQWDHPALQNQYQGWDGVSADHNFSWHDAVHTGGGVCGADSVVPCDDVDHGTHTVGTMLGDDGGSNQIGMAPGARWIACRNMDQGVGTPASYTECFQWFLAPTDLNDENPDPSLAPDIINNSWGCIVSEGCGDPVILKTVVDNTRAAGIVVVASAGNAGSSCTTVKTPTAIYHASYTVGATNLVDSIASFSSRGPVAVDGSNRMKPDVSAPGVGIRSSRLGSSYGNGTGTSMAAPHVAGLMALLISANPALEGQPGSLEALIDDYAVPLTTSQGCGGDAPDEVPNNVYGHGRIDALASVQAALALALPGLSQHAIAVVSLGMGVLGACVLRSRRVRGTRSRSDVRR